MYAKTSQKKDSQLMPPLPVLPMFPKPATLLELHTACPGKKYYTAGQMRQYASKVIALTEQASAAAAAVAVLPPELCALLSDTSDINIVRLQQNKLAKTVRTVSSVRVTRAVRKSARIDVDDLAQEIRRLNGNNSLGAGTLAEALLPFLNAY